MATTKSEKSKGGRPSKLTPEIVKEAVRLANQGNYNVTIAGCLRVSESTFYRWLETGEADAKAEKDTIHAEFWESLKEAHSKCHAACLMDIVNSRGHGWQGKAWFLERRYRDLWGRPGVTQVELTGKDGGPIEVNSARDSLLAAIAGRVEKSQSGQAKENS